MSGFKDAVESDLGIFINDEEFAEEHDLNGTTCTCVVQDPATQERFLTDDDYNGQDAMHGITHIIHVRKADIGELPCEGETFSLDGDYSIVYSCTEYMGMLTITLRENSSGVSGTGGWDC